MIKYILSILLQRQSRQQDLLSLPTPELVIETVGFINADLVVNLFRMPESEWICVDARAFPQPTGVSMVETELYDEKGMIGRASQSNLTMPRFTG